MRTLGTNFFERIGNSYLDILIDDYPKLEITNAHPYSTPLGNYSIVVFGKTTGPNPWHLCHLPGNNYHVGQVLDKLPKGTKIEYTDGFKRGPLSIDLDN